MVKVIALVFFLMAGSVAAMPALIDSGQCTTTTSCSFVIGATGLTSLFIQGGCVTATCDTLAIATVPINSLSCAVSPPVGTAGNTVSGVLCFTLSPIASSTVTVNITACPGFCFAIGASFSGSSTQDGAAQQNASPGPASTLRFGPITPSRANALLITGVGIYCQGQPGTFSVTGGFTIIGSTCDPSVMGGGIAYKISSVSESTIWIVDNQGSGALGITGQILAISQVPSVSSPAFYTYGDLFTYQSHFGFGY